MVGASAQRDAQSNGGLLDTATELTKQYRAAAAAVPSPLPEGVTYPETSDFVSLEKGAMAEPSVADAIANFYWLCAWEDAAITANAVGDKDAQADALASIEKWETLPFTTKHVIDTERAWYAHVLEPAQRGDFAGMKDEYASSCAMYKDHSK